MNMKVSFAQFYVFKPFSDSGALHCEFFEHRYCIWPVPSRHSGAENLLSYISNRLFFLLAHMGKLLKLTQANTNCRSVGWEDLSSLRIFEHSWNQNEKWPHSASCIYWHRSLIYKSRYPETSVLNGMTLTSSQYFQKHWIYQPLVPTYLARCVFLARRRIQNTKSQSKSSYAYKIAHSICAIHSRDISMQWILCFALKLDLC